jgi:hypothetical protein
MAKLVKGIGTAHSPIVSEGAEYWLQHGDTERRNPKPVTMAFAGGDWEELAKKKADWINNEINQAKINERHAATQRAVAATAEALQSANPDVLVIVGDDQDDVFLHDYMMPAIAIYRGENILNVPRDMSKAPDWYKSAAWGHYPQEGPETYPCDPELASHIVKSLVGDGFDVSHVTSPPEGRHVGHAFSFVHRRLMNGSQIPSVPVMLNTYYPPNQPTAKRAYELGKAIRKAIESFPEDKRVVVVASGGLTHPIVDEDLDRGVLRDLENNDMKKIISLDESVFVLGTSEIKNWIAVGGAMEDTGFKMRTIDYIPAYRSEAGTGCGLAFTEWA